MSGTVLKQYIVDAFTDTVFKGNPAAICVLDQWLPDNLMQSITKENNLSETAFTVKNGENYDLRWFTPGGEIDLCGHATLACAYVLMNYYEQGNESVAFSTMSGKLTVVRRGNRGFFPCAAGSKRRQEHEQSRLGRKETVGTFRKRPVSLRGDRSGFRRDAGSPHLGRSRVARVARRQNAGADHAGRPDG